MKNPFLFLLLFSICIASCAKDDTPEDLVVGTWTINSFISEGEELIGIETYTRPEIDTNTGTAVTAAVVETVTGVLTFTAPNSVNLNLITVRENSVTGSSTREDPSPGTFEFQSDTELVLTLSANGETAIFDSAVSSLTENEINISGTITFNGDPTDSGPFTIRASK